MLQLIDTPFGPLAARWTSRGLFACEFVRPGFVDDDPPQRPLTGRNADARQLNAALDGYFHSGRLEWDLNRLDWTGVTEFYQHVLRACYAIPSGQTQSYGQLACAGRQAAGCSRRGNGHGSESLADYYSLSSRGWLHGTTHGLFGSGRPGHQARAIELRV